MLPPPPADVPPVSTEAAPLAPPDPAAPPGAESSDVHAIWPSKTRKPKAAIAQRMADRCRQSDGLSIPRFRRAMSAPPSDSSDCSEQQEPSPPRASDGRYRRSSAPAMRHPQPPVSLAGAAVGGVEQPSSASHTGRVRRSRRPTGTWSCIAPLRSGTERSRWRSHRAPPLCDYRHTWVPPSVRTPWSACSRNLSSNQYRRCKRFCTWTSLRSCKRRTSSWWCLAGKSPCRRRSCSIARRPCRLVVPQGLVEPGYVHADVFTPSHAPEHSALDAPHAGRAPVRRALNC